MNAFTIYKGVMMTCSECVRACVLACVRACVRACVYPVRRLICQHQHVTIVLCPSAVVKG